MSCICKPKISYISREDCKYFLKYTCNKSATKIVADCKMKGQEHLDLCMPRYCKYFKLYKYE